MNYTNQFSNARLVPFVSLLFVLLLSSLLVSSLSCKRNPNTPGASFMGAEEDNPWTKIVERGNPQYIPQWSPDGRYIVFETGGDLTGEIYVATSDGSSVRLLSDMGEYLVDRGPDVSPDGSRIVYATTRHQVEEAEEQKKLGIARRRNFEIETSNLDGSDRRRLTDNAPQDVSPKWSPDGKRIAFIREAGPFEHIDDTDRGLFIMSADGTDVRWLAKFRFMRKDDGLLAPFEFAHRSAGLAWSPDGQRIAFVVQERTDERHESGYLINRDVLYVVGTAGYPFIRLFDTTDKRFASITASPVWSPDGDTLMFLARNSSVLNIYEIGADGFGLRTLLTHTPGIEEGTGKGPSLDLSPDGEDIVFSLGNHVSSWGLPEHQRISSVLYIVGADGFYLRKVASGPFASWSPDGSKIAVQSGRGVPNKAGPFLYTIAPDGSDLRVLVKRVEDDGPLVPANPKQ